MQISQRHINRLFLGGVILLLWLICFTVDVFSAVCTGMVSSAVSIRLEGTNSIIVGNTVGWTLTLVNQSAVTHSNVSQLDIYSTSKSDSAGGAETDTPVSLNVITNYILPGATNIQQVTMPLSAYVAALSNGHCLRADGFVDGWSLNTNASVDIWHDSIYTTMITPFSTNFLALDPSNSVSTGQTVTCTVTYTNIAQITLHGFYVYLNPSSGLVSNVLAESYAFGIGSVTQNQVVVLSTNFTAWAMGSNSIAASIVAQEMNSLCQIKYIAVQ